MKWIEVDRQGRELLSDNELENICQPMSRKNAIHLPLEKDVNLRLSFHFSVQLFSKQKPLSLDPVLWDPSTSSGGGREKVVTLTATHHEGVIDSSRFPVFAVPGDPKRRAACFH